MSGFGFPLQALSNTTGTASVFLGPHRLATFGRRPSDQPRRAPRTTTKEVIVLTANSERMSAAVNLCCRPARRHHHLATAANLLRRAPRSQVQRRSARLWRRSSGEGRGSSHPTSTWSCCGAARAQSGDQQLPPHPPVLIVRQATAQSTQPISAWRCPSAVRISQLPPSTDRGSVA